jgi:hypothetical protein
MAAHLGATEKTGLAVPPIKGGGWSSAAPFRIPIIIIDLTTKLKGEDQVEWRA